MPLNRGYLTSDNTMAGAEMYTPYYAVEPIIKYIPVEWRVWCPFDQEWSAFYRSFVDRGFDVTRSHIDDGQDFFTYIPDKFDIIVTNPPFPLKDRVLERLYSIGKPFAVLLPLTSLQGITRFKYFEKGIQLLAFDQRIGFHNPKSMNTPVEGSPFATAYFCRDLLPKDLIIEHIDKFEKPLKNL